MNGWLWSAVVVSGWLLGGTIVAVGVGKVLRAADRRALRREVPERTR
jgi:hypothetical protein